MFCAKRAAGRFIRICLPARRFLQYRLRTLFVLVVAFAIPLSFWATREHQYRVRCAAVSIIFEHGGDVRVENAELERYFRLRSLKPRDDSDFLRRDDVIVGASCAVWQPAVSAMLMIPTLKSLRLGDGTGGIAPGPLGANSRVGLIDMSLLRLAGLPKLENLDIARTSVSERGIANLKGSRSLRALNLTLTPITDAALKHLSALPQLEELDLSRTTITDEGVRYLASLNALRVLNLSFTNVTGNGLDSFGSMSRLERLDLSFSPVTDEGARHLAALVSLRHLDLRDTKISGAALEHLSNLRRLTHLDLSGRNIDDEALTCLADIPKLTWLNLSDTRVTDAGLAILSRFNALEYLILWRCRISDVGIMSLRAAKSLKDLDVYETPITYDGADELERQNPQISVGGLPLEEIDGDELRPEEKG